MPRDNLRTLSNRARKGSPVRRTVETPAWGVLAAALLVVTIQSATAQTPAPQTQPALPPGHTLGRAPRIHVEQPTHDFGQVWSGTVNKHTFKIQNLGQEPLKITKIQRSCGCTVAGEYDRVIGPGALGELTLSINTNRFAGSFSKSVTVISNDPQNPKIKLTLTGNARPYIKVQPLAADFGTLGEDEAKTVILKLTNNTDDPVNITLGSEEPIGPFQPELVPVTPGREYDLKITATPPYGRRSVRGNLHLRTDHPKSPKLLISCRAHVRPRLEVSPRILRLPNPQPEPFEQVLQFTNHGQEPVKLLSVETDVEGLEVTFQETSAGKDYTLTVRGPADFTPASDEGVVVLHVDDKQSPTIEVPVRLPGARRARKQAQADRPAGAWVGKPAPPFELETTDGEKLSGDALQGQVTLLDFYATTSGFSKWQLGLLEQVWKRYEDKGVRIIGVSQDRADGPGSRTREQILQHRDQLNLTFDIALDPARTVGDLFQVVSYPTLVVIGKTGVVEAVHVGGARDEDLIRQLETQLDLLLAGKTHQDFPSPTLAPPKADTPPDRPDPASATESEPAAPTTQPASVG
jgi:peroxiredoxin